MAFSFSNSNVGGGKYKSFLFHVMVENGFLMEQT
jgi:hypothetical protein